MSNNIIPADIEALIAFLRTSNRFTNGPKVREFEDAWSDWLGVRHSLMVNSGSSANFITMSVLRDLYGPGEVIVPPITWESDLAAVFAAGLTPVFADVTLHNLALDEAAVMRVLSPKTRAVFLTHVLGFNGLSQSMLDLLAQRGIVLIEDVCESHGATFQDKKCGTYGLASNFSFYYAHHLSTIEGGMICTDDEEFYQRCRLYRSHGLLRESSDAEFKSAAAAAHPDLNPEFLFVVPGFNMRSTELNAVVGLSALTRLDENNQKRCRNFELFLSELDPSRYYTDFDLAGSVNYAFVVMLRKPDPEFFSKLTSCLSAEKVEFRRGTAGGGNMARQPFVRERMTDFDPTLLHNADFVHFYGLYTGNYPDLDSGKIHVLAQLLNSI
ncbi:MAG: DegT/DnrJ/EryC1/StrS family aminotransferase [Succinivibrio sp.]|nr:DegT/DnrJ/EryC1/StrS family aminotransferase [Succinivibrio sp.]